MANRSTGGLRCKGQELIEFAFLLPVLVLILFGAIDLGRAFHAAITIENAARVGARYGARNPGEFDDAIQAACNEAFESGITLDCGNISVTGSASGTPVTVTVSYDFQLIIVSILPDSNITLVRSAEMLIP